MGYKLARFGALQKKEAPVNRGLQSGRKPEVTKYESASLGRALAVSEAETGKVAVAIGDVGAGGQQAVDSGHQADEQGAGGHEADRGSLGHFVPFF